MVSVMELREQAVQMEPSIEQLRKEMVQWLRINTDARMINVMLWYDGQFKIMSTHPVPDRTLNGFLKEFGLQEKGHFNKKESEWHAIYDFKHWDFKEDPN